MSNKGYPSIACSEANMANALCRYLKYFLCFDKILINPLNDPFRIRDSLDIAEKSEFLIVDAFINGEPKGYHFAKNLGKKALLLFYSGQLDIEKEGTFWIVLPEKLNQLKNKIQKIFTESNIEIEEYHKISTKFPQLNERKTSHV